MKIKQVLISQQEPKADSSPYHELERQNIKVNYAAFIEVEGQSAREVRNQKIDFAKFSAVILTSKNSVDHFFRVAEELRFPVPDAMKYFCQSEAIAFYLQKYIVYRKRKIHIGGKEFSDLMPLFNKQKELKYLIPCGETLSEENTNILNDSEIDWTKVCLYKTKSINLSQLMITKYDLIAFYSPAGILSLVENFPDYQQNETAIATFGKATTDAAKKAGLRVEIEAPNKENPSMASALSKYAKLVNGKK
ncbi:MAG: uroporphyrinogen-III synthase [Solirubrobacteraceae bacterium]